MRGRTNLRASNKKRQVSKATRSRDSIFHPSDKLRKSRSTGRMGNRYTVPIPEIKQVINRLLWDLDIAGARVRSCLG